jgi:hypothetical protein
VLAGFGSSVLLAARMLLLRGAGIVAAPEVSGPVGWRAGGDAGAPTSIRLCRVRRLVYSGRKPHDATSVDVAFLLGVVMELSNLSILSHFFR